MKPWPRSSTQLSKSSSVILLGQLRTGSLGARMCGLVVLFDDALGIAGERQRVGAVVVVVLLGLILDDDGSAVLGVVEQTVVGGLELRTCGVGADAEDDGVVGGEVAGGDVLRRKAW